MILYDIFKPLIWLFFHAVYRIRIAGLENIPESGGAIICPNHIALGDPLLVAITVPRKVRFMAKAELFKIPFIRFFLRHWGAYPVKRGEADISAIKNTFKILKNNGLIGLFPEGTRIRTGNFGTANAGVAMFSIKSGKPVIPVYIYGRYFIFSKLNIIFGQPFYFNINKEKLTNDDYKELSQTVMKKISELKQKEGES